MQPLLFNDSGIVSAATAMVFVAPTFVLLIVDEVQGKVKNGVWHDGIRFKPRVAELIRNAEGGMKEHYMTLIKGLIDSGFDVIALCRLSKKDRNRLTKWER